MVFVVTSLNPTSFAVFIATVQVAFLSGTALCDVRFISTVSEYASLYEDVKAGTTYEETTVYLESDIDFSSSPTYYSITLGNNDTKIFKGTLDGQGHILSNLRVIHPPVYQYAGLVGHSTGMTIRNVVIDSFIVESTPNYNTKTYSFAMDTYIGGLVGYCVSTEKPCIIENVVNTGSITFGHTISANLYLSGIAGYLGYGDYVVILRNCANYGTITQKESVNNLYIGGIVGYSSGGFQNTITIQNCLNYGALSKTSSGIGSVQIGGIVGYGTYSTIENCVSAGAISSSSISDSIGSIMGYSSYIELIHGFWTSSTGYNDACGSGSESTTTAISNSYLITLNTTTVSGLNEYAESNEDDDNKWSRWLFNENNDTVTFYINNSENSTSLTSQVILLPSIAVKAGYTFSWYSDSNKKNIFESVSVSGDTTLYGGITSNYYTVTFDFDNGTTMNEIFQYNAEITYPDNSSIMMEGYTFNGWDTYITVMPSHNLTVKALWKAINYTVTFDFDNGTTLNETFQYKTEITYPDNSSIVMEGHTFNGWDKDITTMPSHNFTIKALWTEVPANSTEYVEIVFGTKDFEKEDIKIIISKYTNSSDFTIVSYEKDDTTGATKVIVKFNDKKQAENFYRAIDNSGESFITRILYVQESDFDSYACTPQPVLLRFLLNLIFPLYFFQI